MLCFTENLLVTYVAGFGLLRIECAVFYRGSFGHVADVGLFGLEYCVFYGGSFFS